MSFDETDLNKPPFNTDESTPRDDDADRAADPMAADDDTSESDEDETRLVELASPFVRRWNGLVSQTNFEKGHIINAWRNALIESGASIIDYGDEAWARRVGGVTAAHVGRLRRVHDRFADSCDQYDGLFWSHFFAALDWDDAPLWLEGAVQEGWSVSQMRQQRWQAHGAVASDRPTDSQIVSVELDEDVDPNLANPSTQPAQGGGRDRAYDDDAGGQAGPFYEDADFGDEVALSGSPPPASPRSGDTTDGESPSPPGGVGPFAGLPAVPDDVSEAFESLKLAILRHRSSKWETVDRETLERYLQAFLVLLHQDAG